MVKRQTQSSTDVFEYVIKAGVLGWISCGHLRILDLKCALMRMRCYNKLRSIIVSGLKQKQVEESQICAFVSFMY